MNEQPVSSTKLLRRVAIGLMVLFAAFFSVNFTENPLPFGWNKAEGASFLKGKSVNTNQKLMGLQMSSLHNDTLSVLLKRTLDASLLYGTSDTIRERVLLIGDSQLEGLKYPVNEYCIKNDHELAAVVIWYGSSTKNWATTDSLRHFIRKFKPTVVVFAIGLNEIFARDLEKRRSYVQQLRETFEETRVKYYWVGPAAWTQDNGITAIMEEEIGKHFFPSHRMEMERGDDGRHPSRKAAKWWFDDIAQEMTRKGILHLPNKVDTLQKLRIPKIVTIAVPKSK